MLTVVLLLTIALGIGSTVAILSVIHAVLLRPLPEDDSDRIVWIYETSRSRNGSASVGHLHDWTEQSTVFEHTAAASRGSFNLSDGEPERVFGMQVTPGYFRVVHIAAVIGRYFTDEDVARDSRLVVLGHGLWQRQFGGDPSVVGRQMVLNGVSRTVVGVMPKRFMWRGADVYVPVVFERGKVVEGVRDVHVLGRLKAGITDARRCLCEV